jgi:copper chaperone NosL
MRSARAGLSLAFLLAAACGEAGPREVILHADTCGYCRMEVADARFAAEAITGRGRVQVFDSVECLAGYVRGAPAGVVASVWVTDFEHPGTFVRATDAGFLVESDLRVPMGSAVAFASAPEARAAQSRLGGRVVSWEQLLADSTARAVHEAH